MVFKGYMAIRKCLHDTESNKKGDAFLSRSSLSDTVKGSLDKAFAEDAVIRTPEYEPHPVIAIVPVSVVVDYILADFFG